MDITESLFADLNVNANSLNTEKDYLNFGKKVSDVLYQGQAPYRIPVFFKELVRDLSKQIESKKIKEILDSVTAIYNAKVKEEKDKEKTGKGGKSAKAQLKAGKQHQNTQMMNDLMGAEELEDEEEEDYEDDEVTGVDKKVKGKGKVQEEEFDFM